MIHFLFIVSLSYHIKQIRSQLLYRNLAIQDFCPCMAYGAVLVLMKYL
jgi:hypothetical protein